jgi:hypothetical protein
VRCGGDKDATYKRCVASFGEGNFDLVMGRCCYECKPKGVVRHRQLCADYDSTKAQCQKRFGDKPFDDSAARRHALLLRVPRVDERVRQPACVRQLSTT